MGLSERQPRATYRDVLNAPPNMVAELIGGELHLQPRPVMRHARTIQQLSFRVEGKFGEGGGSGDWYFAVEPEIHLGEDVVVPDIAGWRVGNLPDDLDVAYMETPPDWVCEVLSPSTRGFDLTEKRDVYGAAGVGHIWFVDPQAKTLEAFENRDGAWTLLAALRDEAEVSVEPFDAARFALSALWLPERGGKA